MFCDFDAFQRGTKMSQNENPSVLIGELGDGNRVIGSISLNAPEKLNAFDIDMLVQIAQALDAWKKDDRIAAILIHSPHGKAFCAGGDVKSIVVSMKDRTAEEVADEFFTTEYFIDHEIHEYPKPIVCWAHGITMGGGIGLMNGAKFRIVNETTVMAMPEISIGLFPDVGSSYFLNLFSHGLGLYLGLTGHRFSGHDAIDWEMADYFIPQSMKHKVVTDLSKLEWTDNPGANGKLIEKYLQDVCDVTPERDIETYDYLAGMNYEDLCDELRENIYFAEGSRLSRRLIFELLKWGQGKTLRECFEMEWVLAQNCVAKGDFKEGVRALLIDKDKLPSWGTVGDFEAYFKWDGANTLAKKFDEAGY